MIVLRNTLTDKFLTDTHTDENKIICTLKFNSDVNNAIKYENMESAQMLADVIEDEFDLKLAITETESW